ncbi:MAG: endonuclease/exonuclease/phosphatase family protein [Archangium sp.]|nr:endonuclease/exonuclease/phosphatase family protein [Archangium sp.]
MRVLTWNVLHRVHAETHGEPAVERWPDEPSRTRALLDTLSRTRADVVLLQEVSGDVLAALRGAFTSVTSHRFPRMPRPKRPTTAVTDASEHLVIGSTAAVTVWRAQTAVNDPGKGLLAVEQGGVLFVSTHVSWGEKRAPQLEALARVVREHTGPLVIGGDFNVEASVVCSALGLRNVALAPGSAKTRVGREGGGDIDHLFVRGLEVSAAQVLEHDLLSDHAPVVLEVQSASSFAPPTA